MADILDKIYQLDITQLGQEISIGRCAICSKNVTGTESRLLEEFWTFLCTDWNEKIYIDLQVDCQNLHPDQFNEFHEPLLCIECLRSNIHQE
jgi:hypothetical protein